jgi:CHAT domain-containing protein
VRNSDLRASFRARSQRYFELQTDLLMQRHDADPRAGHDLQALVASDSARARGLLESFGGNLPDFIRDADAALLADRDAKARRVNALERRRVQAMNSTTLAAPSAVELSQAISAYRDAEGRVFASSPRYRGLLTPPQVGLATLRRDVGDDAVLVEYALGENRSFVWTVSSAGAHSAVLPGRKTIEDAALKLHRAVTARNTPVSDATIASRRARLAAADREATAAATALARMILAPIEPQLADRKRIALVVDGSLSLVPFALLPSGAKRTPLAATHTVALLPSATMLTEIRRPRQRQSNAVAVFADPVFDPNDPRVARSGAQTTVAESQPMDLLMAARRDGLTRFGRLRYSREEADAIAALAPKGSHAALDFSASRSDVESDAVSRARIVHFATHGIVNTNQPELSGLVLSLVDSKGQPQDGFLRLHDIYRLRLNADLVVLSACRSAVGRDLKGEGPMALTRGFLVAGAPRVVATLWDVDDRATAELMRRFYAGVLQRNEPPAMALRSAQMAMAATPQWSAPFFWAGFMLTGEWR